MSRSKEEKAEEEIETEHLADFPGVETTGMQRGAWGWAHFITEWWELERTSRDHLVLLLKKVYLQQVA